MGEDKKTGAVFPDAESHGLSQRLNKAIRAAGVPKSRRLVAYSFRHGMKQALREAEAPQDIQDRILGHGRRTVSENYGAPRSMLIRLRDALERAVPHLGRVEVANYRPEELPKETPEERG